MKLPLCRTLKWIKLRLAQGDVDLSLTFSRQAQAPFPNYSLTTTREATPEDDVWSHKIENVPCALGENDTSTREHAGSWGKDLKYMWAQSRASTYQNKLDRSKLYLTRRWLKLTIESSKYISGKRARPLKAASKREEGKKEVITTDFFHLGF